MSLNKTDFKALADLIKGKSGIVLTEDKDYLVEGRLMPVAKKHQMDGLEALVREVMAQPSGPLMTEVVEAMTTNESFFFRDTKPFERLVDIALPRLMDGNAAKRSLNIWCAACSTGQEPYSILMTLFENPKYKDLQVSITATDIDNNVLDRAKSGLYTQFEVQRGVPIQMLMKYFKQDGEQWQISPDLTSKIRFEQFNLLDAPTRLGRFDIVFCRNVLIYFDTQTKETILRNISKVVDRKGSLFMGAAEGLLGMETAFKPCPDAAGVFILQD